MLDKRVTIDDIVAEIRDGMTVGIGGWGSRRKPKALVRALARSSVKDLRLVSYGGPDVGILCRAGKVREVVYAFVSLDSIALEPHFRNARQTGAVASPSAVIPATLTSTPSSAPPNGINRKVRRAVRAGPSSRRARTGVGCAR